MTSEVFEIVTTSRGATSIRNNVVGEIMHNPVGPWAEANALYIDQSNLADRMRSSEAGDPPLVIFDVGLGAAANALATLHCARKIRPRRALKLISFERDLDLLKFALFHAKKFDHFHGFEVAIATLLSEGAWREEGIEWILRTGDFLNEIDREVHLADLVWFDPYSPAVNSDMWTYQAFQKLYPKCNPKGSTLYTYSRATPIRVGLFYSGFFVGAGSATGLKDETTQASTQLSDLAKPLGEDWLKRWSRSHTPHPLGSSESQFEEIRATVLRHPQFLR